jgi:hypothetical protein
MYLFLCQRLLQILIIYLIIPNNFIPNNYFGIPGKE